MKKQGETSMRIRLAAMAILVLFIALAAVAYLSGQQVKRSSELITTDAVPGTIDAHEMRMAMSRSIGWVMVAASAQTTQSRDASLKTVHEADVDFTNALNHYLSTIIINPTEDRKLLNQVTSRYAEYCRQRMAYEALILAGDRDKSADFLESNLVPAYVSVLKPAEELLDYNHNNSVTYANSIHNSVRHLYLAVAVVMVLALICATVLVVNFSIRRREVKELRESEEKFSKAFRSNPSGMAISEMETGEFLEVNESYCRIMGYSPTELIGRTPVELRIWSSAKERKNVFQSLLDGHPLRDFEMQTRSKDGSSKTILVNAEPIELGGKRCILSLIQDITERKQFEQKRAELAAIVESSDDAIIGKSLTGIITSWNRGAVKIFGYSAAEAIGQSILMLIPPERQHEESEILEKIKQGEAVEHFETVRVRKDGRQVAISATISPVRDGNEKVIGASKIARDITASKQVEQKLHETESSQRTLIDAVQEAFCLMKPDGTLTVVNQAFARRFGKTTEELVGVNGYDLSPPDVAAKRKVFYQQLLELSQPITFEDQRGGLDLENRIYPAKNAAGKITHFATFSRDITEQKRAKQELISKTALLEAQVDSTIDGILVVDTEGKRVLQNQRFFDLFKVPDEIARDDDHSKVLQYSTSLMKNPKQFIERVAYLYAHPDEISHDEIELTDGRVIDRDSAPVRDKTGKYYGRIWTFRDITARKRNEETVRASEAALKEAQRLAHIGSSRWDARIDETIWSDELYQIVGWDPAKRPPTHEERAKIYTPESFAILDRTVKRCLATGEPYNLQLEIVRPDGEHRQVYVRGTSIRDEGGTPIGLQGTLQDITEIKQAEESLRRLNRELNAISNCHQVLVRAEDENKLLQDICQIVCEKAGYQMAWVGYADQDEGKTVRPVAWTGTEAGYLATAQITWADTERGRGPTGTAIRTGVTTYISNFASDPSTALWREAALKRGFHSAISLPLKDENGYPFGVLTIYSTEPNSFTTDEIRLLEELASDLAFGITTLRLRAERKRAQDEMRSANERYSRQEAALMELTRAYALRRASIAELKREVTEITARTLGVERVSIWGYGRDHQSIVCQDLFEKSTRSHSAGAVLHAGDIPAYFRALEEGNAIVAHDAYHDPRTSELTETYLRPLGISSMLDTPIHIIGSVTGVICCEHVGPSRQWTADEQTFAIAIANVVSLLLAEEERQQIEEQFRQAQKMEAVGQLAGGVAHDYNNILAATMIQLGMLLTEPNLAPDLRETLVSLKRGADRAANLTRQLLVFSRRQAMQMKQVELNALLEDELKMLRRLLGENIELSIQAQKGKAWIEADAGMIEQVIMNLCINARDAMANGGRLTVGVTSYELAPNAALPHVDAHPGSFYCLSVRDTGCGMSPETIRRIFEPFFTTKEVGKGTGLGLATVYGIARQHQGWVEVNSEPGQGSEFRVMLPAASKVSASAIFDAGGDFSGGTETILIVEDEETVRQALVHCLRFAGYQVHAVADGLAALHEWKDRIRSIDLLITDMIMPGGLNGLELAEAFKAIKPELPVIIMSGYSKDLLDKTGIPVEHGYVFQSKPCDPASLTALIRKSLSQAIYRP